MRVLGVPFFIILVITTSCITYDPSLYITEIVSYDLPPAVEIDQSIQTVSVEPEGFGRALRVNSGFNRRFEPLSGAGESGNANISVRETNYRIKRVQGKDRYEKNFLVNLHEFFSGEDFSDFDFSIIREQHIPRDVYEDLYGFNLENGDVLSDDETYVIRIEEIGVEAIIINFDLEAVIKNTETDEVFLKLESGYLNSFLLYEPEPYDVTVEAGKGGEVVAEPPDENEILSEKKTELFYSLINRISPRSKSYLVEIRPIISYESWPLVYDLMKFGAWNKAMERLLRDREDFTAENSRAEFDYVIGSIYHVLGDLEQAESYLNKALPVITWGFEPVIEEQLNDIKKRKNL